MPDLAHLGRLRATAAVLVLIVLAALVPAATVSAASSYDLETRYTVGVHLDWDTRWVDVTTTIDVDNTSGRSIDRLDLNTVAAKLGSMKNLRARVNGATRKVTKMGQTLIVPLGFELAAGASATVFVRYKARLGTTSGGRAYLFAKLNGVAQLYRFIPWVSRRVPFGNSNHGEQFVTPVSPRVEVTVSADRVLKWATSGRQVKKLSPRKFRFVASDVRDFNIAASPRYKTSTGKTGNGKTRIVAHTVRHDGRRLVRLAKQEIARYASLTGVPYPHPTYRIAETGGGLAMESPALIWIPRSRPASDHPYLVSHETAHQWWYSTVGNDQSTDAFADEALADYFSRKKHLSIRSSRCKTDRLDRDTQAYSDACYFEVIYVQGARFLNNLRRDYGTAEFKAAIRAYTKGNRDDISNNARLLEAFRATMGNGVLPRYRNRFPSIY
ncbi:MAG: hypothetical protein AB1Z67_01370 [Candidatus Limnocylindrales bacterium]